MLKKKEPARGGPVPGPALDAGCSAKGGNAKLPLNLPLKSKNHAENTFFLVFSTVNFFPHKFGRSLQGRNNVSFHFDADFQVESYLRHQGNKFVERFDANAFLYITKAGDYYDFPNQHDSVSAVEAFSKSRARFLVVSFTSDWLYPTYQSKAMVQAMKKCGLDVSFGEIEAEWGHDAFLLPNKRLTALMKGFLERVSRKTSNK